MIKVVRYNSLQKNEWNEFIKFAKNSLFMFDRNYMDYHSDRFQDHSLMFYEKNKLVAILPISEHENEFTSHGGLTYGGMITGESMKQTKMLECFETLEKYCINNGVKNFRYKAVPFIYHTQPAEEDIYALYYKGAVLEKIEASTVVRLNNPYKMNKLRKRQISKAVRSGVVVGIDDDKNAYYGFMQMQDKILLERHNVNAVHSGKEMYLLHSRFPDNIHLYTAKHEGELLGGVILFIYEKVIHTQYLCASEKAREIGALDAVIDHIIEKYKKTKEWLDFGISTEAGGHYLNEGLISQKEGFGGRTNIYETWKINL